MSTEPGIGRDEWVARSEERRQRKGFFGPGADAFMRLPWWFRWGLFVAFVALIPLMSSNGYVRRVSFDTLLYVLLALGLNVVVGWGGLLDLGYVAFYGFGAYLYAWLDSNQFHVHLPSLLAIPLVVAASAVLGFLVGLPSRRLSGDYLAIVTLFFLQAFLTIMINGESIFGVNFTNGANGIAGVDPLNLFGHHLPVAHLGVFNVWYLYVALAFFVVVLVALRFVNDSRTGRAWRALREDSLAAELMSMPVNRLKLMAFAFGAATAGLTGTLFASLNAGVFPASFALPLLITIYAMVILGGAGSQAGVVLGAVLVNVLLEVLRSPQHSRWVFYAAVLAGLLAFVRPWKWLAVVLAGTLAFGFVVRVTAHAIHPSWTAGATQGSDSVGRLIGHWVTVPNSLGGGKAVAYVGLIAMVLLLTTLKGPVRMLVMIPTIYMGAFVWENVLAQNPEVTRFVLLGALLVAVMTTRPQGILGTSRVEII
jgi:ABC-type branched-subunit amino acid transport system permease subunit